MLSQKAHQSIIMSVAAAVLFASPYVIREVLAAGGGCGRNYDKSCHPDGDCILNRGNDGFVKSCGGWDTDDTYKDTYNADTGYDSWADLPDTTCDPVRLCEKCDPVYRLYIIFMGYADCCPTGAPGGSPTTQKQYFAKMPDCG